MAVVGPDLMEPGLHSGYYVNGVPGAKRCRSGEASGEEFNLAENVIRDRNQSPSFVRQVVQEKIRQFRCGFWLERSFPHFAVERARQFGDAERRCVYVVSRVGQLPHGCGIVFIEITLADVGSIKVQACQRRSSSRILPMSLVRGSLRMNASRLGNLFVGGRDVIGRSSATGTPRDSIT
jgi:hypothetical protein